MFCLHPTSSRREMYTPSVSNVNYHKFLHDVNVFPIEPIGRAPCENL